MKKVALVFVMAVFVPSLVLAWLAVRSLRDQQFILERQQSLLYQGVADAKAKEVQEFLADYQHAFVQQVNKLVGKGSPENIVGSFDDLLRKDWPLAQVGFCVSLPGQIKAPSPHSRAEARKFLTDNGRFLANEESVDVYAYQKQAFNANNGIAINAQVVRFPETATGNRSLPRGRFQQPAVRWIPRSFSQRRSSLWIGLRRKGSGSEPQLWACIPGHPCFTRDCLLHSVSMPHS